MADSWVAYVGHMLFPWGQAASRRVYGNAMSLADAGHHVVVASGSDRPCEINPLVTSAAGGTLSHIGLGVSPGGQEAPLQKAMRLLFASTTRTIRWLDAQPTKPSHIILYGGYTPYLVRLLPWCRRHKVALIADVVEWHDAAQKPGGVFGIANLNIVSAMRLLYPRCDGIISISSFLSTYFARHGCPLVQVPPTIDFSETSSAAPEQAPSGPLTLVYAGDPEKKDLLRPIIEGMRMADPGGKRSRLTVVGPSIEQVRSCCDGRLLPGNIHVLGRIPQNEVAKVLRSANFSVLLRPQMRFANAGFPTKFVESMANGVPVIANLTSDLGAYLHDGINGFVCYDHTAEAFSQAFERALRLDGERLWQMRLEASQQARRSFDYRLYSDSLATLLSRVRLF